MNPDSQRIVMVAVYFALFCSLWGGCLSRESVVIEGSEPLEKIHIRPSGRAVVYASDSVELSTLAPVGHLESLGFWPGISVEEAENLMGPPSYRANAREGRDEIFGFHIAAGAIEVVRQTTQSDGVESQRWLLRYRPQACKASLDPRLVKQLEALPVFPPEVVIMAGPENQDAASVDFDEEQQCDVIWWQFAVDQERGTEESPGGLTPG